MKRVIALTVALVLSGCGSCQDEPPPDESKRAELDPTDVAASGDVAIENKRAAYGVPFPPEIIDVRKFPTHYQVTTTLNLDEVERFFKARLVDWEILRTHERQLILLGLREYMPYVRAQYAAGPRTPVRVTYYPARKKPAPKARPAPTDDADAGSASNGSVAAPSKPKARPSGRVTTRTSSGELLAPGAEWGKPYTPPPGSPLHKPRFRSNFGRPFGEWIEQ